MQYPFREVSYEKLKLDLMVKLGLADRLTVLKYLGRPKIVRSNRISQEVRYLKSGTVVPKEHRFTKVLERKKGYIEIFGYAEMFLKNGKPYFRLFYENLVNKPLVLFQECECVESGEKNIYHIYEVGEVQKEHDSAGNLDDSKIINREKKKECLIGRYINLVYKCKDSENKKEQDYPEFQIFYAEPLKSEPDRAKIKWRDDS